MTSRWYIIRPITIGPHKSTKICWCADQQMWVHLWGPCVMGVYYIMIIIEISKKRGLIGRIFHFRRSQKNTLVALDGTIWSCLVWLLPSRQNGENACFEKHLEHRYFNGMIDLYSHSMRVPWCGHFCSTELYFVDALTWVLMIRWPSQNRPLAKKDWRTLIRACQNTPWDLCTYQQTMLWIHGTIILQC